MGRNCLCLRFDSGTFLLRLEVKYEHLKPYFSLNNRLDEFLKAARRDCSYVCGEDGLCYQHHGLPATPCPNEDEHKRTALLLRKHVDGFTSRQMYPAEALTSTPYKEPVQLGLPL